MQTKFSGKLHQLWSVELSHYMKCVVNVHQLHSKKKKLIKFHQ